ncbi:MAG: GLPGLI family protein [Saprospiraceae bacterium]
MQKQNCPTLLLGLALAASYLFSPIAYGQAPEGEIRYLVTHNWTKKMAALDYLSKQQRERIAYMWGNRSEWNVFTTLYFSRTESKYEDSEEAAEADDDGYSWKRDVFYLKRNFEQNRIHDVVTLLNRTYIVEDTLKAPNWKILNDMKEVAGHICMNAVWEDTLKKQTITAWFALDMPVPAGPERLCGLPGLILEADYNDGAQVITADRITLKKLDKELALPKKQKGKKVNEAGYLDVVRQHIMDKRKSEEPWFWGIRY